MSNTKKTIAVIICALNEEKNIGNLLGDICTQVFSRAFSNNFELVRIVIVSDGSTDKTADIVRTIAASDPRIELIENPERIGKIFSLNKAFSLVSEDHVILFDADVRLEENTIDELAKPLLQQSYALIGGNPVPFFPKSLLNIGEQASYFSWLLLQNIKKSHPQSIYSAHGRVLMLSRDLYKTVQIDHLSTPGDDQYIYLKANHNFSYQGSAIVKYSMPGTASDYLKQSVRFRIAKQTRLATQEALDIDNEFKIPDQLTILIKTLALHPYQFACWALLYTIGFLKFSVKFKGKKDLDMKKVWGEVKSTK